MLIPNQNKWEALSCVSIDPFLFCGIGGFWQNFSYVHPQKCYRGKGIILYIRSDETGSGKQEWEAGTV